MFVLAAADTAQSISYWPLGILAICVVFIVVSIVKFRIHPFLALILSALLAGLLSKNLPDANTENIGVFKARTDMHIFTYEADKAGKVGVKYGNDPLRSDAIEPTVKGIKEKYKKKAYLSLHLISSVTTKTEDVAATIQAADQHGVPFTIRHKDKAGAGSKLKNAVTWAMRGFGDTAGGIGLVIALAAIIGTCMMGSGAADRVVRGLLNTFGEQRSGIVLLLSGFLLSIPVFFDTVKKRGIDLSDKKEEEEEN